MLTNLTKISNRFSIKSKNCLQLMFTLIRKMSSNESDVQKFVQILGDNSVKRVDLEAFNSDWLRTHKGNSELVLEPKSTAEVSSLMSYLNQRSLQCVIQSGNTSLVAGSVPIDDEIIISMTKMNKIKAFDSTTGILECESGCVLQTLEEYVNSRGYIMPYDLGAKGSCLIGGNLATNAGGLRFIRYGSLHGSVLGIEVVLADGRVLDLMSSMRKDNTGYDLKHLFIGSEGTLGVITKVSILCPLKLSNQTVAILSLQTYDDLLKAYHLIRSELSEYLTAFEMMDAVSMDAVVTNLNQSHPFNSCQPFYILIELSANDCQHLESRLSQVLEKLMSDNLIIDGTYSSDESLQKFLKLKSYRERIAEGLLRDGYTYKYDVSLPLNVYYKLVEVMRERLKGTNCIRICGYGHLGDSNLHFNVTSKEFDKQIIDLIEPFLYEYVSKNNGSISAEHGLGLKKRNHIHFSKKHEAIVLMKQIKKLFDPNCILNPGKVLPN